jgi:glycerol-3-phosphate acyltransferase PlsY
LADLWPLYLAGSLLLGAVPTGYLVVRRRGHADIRTLGSGNIGATNVLRTQGWPAALLTLLLDIAKGALPVVAGWQLGAGPVLALGGGLAAVCGHIFSPFMKFRGGKGVAPLAGALLVFAPAALAAFAAAFLLILTLCRYVSLASMAGTVAALAVLGLSQPPGVAAPALAVGVLVLACHHANIGRLLAGRENRFSLGKRHE